MSQRSDLAARIAAKICELELTNPYGGDVNKYTNKYVVTFSYPRNLDGSVTVYGEKFILVEYQTRYGFLANRDRHVFTSEADAVGFLEAAFKDLNEEKAAEFISRAKK